MGNLDQLLYPRKHMSLLVVASFLVDALDDNVIVDVVSYDYVLKQERGRLRWVEGET
jgi:hypothetical protein